MRLYQPVQLLTFAAFVVLGAWLATRFGVWTTVPMLAGGALLAASLGGVLVRTSTVGRVTWRNHVAGLLLPLSGLLGSGALVRLVASTVICVTAAGAVGAFLGHAPWLAAAVALDVAAVLQVAAGMLLSNTARRLVAPLAVVCVAAIAGIQIHAAGRTTTGIVIAAAPVVLTAAIPAFYVLVLTLMGRKIRWN